MKLFELINDILNNNQLNQVISQHGADYNVSSISGVRPVINKKGNLFVLIRFSNGKDIPIFPTVSKNGESVERAYQIQEPQSFSDSDSRYYFSKEQLKYMQEFCDDVELQEPNEKGDINCADIDFNRFYPLKSQLELDVIRRCEEYDPNNEKTIENLHVALLRYFTNNFSEMKDYIKKDTSALFNEFLIEDIYRQMEYSEIFAKFDSSFDKIDKNNNSSPNQQNENIFFDENVLKELKSDDEMSISKIQHNDDPYDDLKSEVHEFLRDETKNVAKEKKDNPKNSKENINLKVNASSKDNNKEKEQLLKDDANVSKNSKYNKIINKLNDSEKYELLRIKTLLDKAFMLPLPDGVNRDNVDILIPNGPLKIIGRSSPIGYPNIIIKVGEDEAYYLSWKGMFFRKTEWRKLDNQSYSKLLSGLESQSNNEFVSNNEIEINEGRFVGRENACVLRLSGEKMLDNFKNNLSNTLLNLEEKLAKESKSYEKKDENMSEYEKFIAAKNAFSNIDNERLINDIRSVGKSITDSYKECYTGDVNINANVLSDLANNMGINENSSREKLSTERIYNRRLDVKDNPIITIGKARHKTPRCR